MKPIVLIPGIGGSILVDRTQTHKQFMHWKLLDNRWLNIYPYHPSSVKRWKKDMAYQMLRDKGPHQHIVGFTNYENPNIDVYDMGGTQGMKDVVSEFLLLSKEHQQNLELQYHFRYFHSVCEHFYKMGYEDHRNLIGLPYDFRLALDPTARREMFEAFQTQIEQAVKRNRYPCVVVTHSFGGIMFKWFLHSPWIDDAWIKEHIYRWVCISCPFGGSAQTIPAVTSGDFYLPMFYKLFKEELATNSAMIACLPNMIGYDPHHPLIIDPNHKYTIRDYHSLAKKGYLAFEIWRDLYEPYLNMLCTPLSLKTHIVRANQMDTPDTYYVKSLEEYPYKRDYVHGDGVVANHSLSAYRKVLVPSLTKDMIVPFSDHTSLISDHRVIQVIEQYARHMM